MTHSYLFSCRSQRGSDSVDTTWLDLQSWLVSKKIFSYYFTDRQWCHANIEIKYLFFFFRTVPFAVSSGRYVFIIYLRLHVICFLTTVTQNRNLILTISQLSWSVLYKTGVLLHQLVPVQTGCRQISACQCGPLPLHTSDLRLLSDQPR